ncbi:MAG TPA: hypothetical protein VIV34_00085, partial [Pseudolabrys sp.]
MTFLPIRLKRVLLRNLVRPGRAGRASAAALMLTAIALLSVAPSHTARADDPIKGEVKAVVDGGFVRLLFQFDEAVEASARISGAIVVISFNKPVAIAVERLGVNASDYISAARRDPDGSAIRIALTRKLKINTIAAGERLYVDLLPESWKGPMPGLPQEVIDELVRRAREAERQLHQQRAAEKNKKPPLVRVKVANQPTFVRYVFTMPGTVNVVPERADGRLTLSFDQQVNWDLADAKASLPPTLKSIESEVDFDTVAVVFTLVGTPEVRAFREDRNIVVDIGLDGAKPKKAEEAAPKQAASPSASPTISSPQTTPVKDAPASKATVPAKTDASVPPSSGTMPAVPSSTPAVPKEKEAEHSQAAPVVAPSPQQQSEAPAPSPVAASTPSAAVAAEAKPQQIVPPPASAPAPPAAAPPAAAATDAPKAPPQSAANTDSGQPAPDPKSTVVAGVHQSGNSLRVELPFAVSTPAAVFYRADTLWLVFDSAAQIDITALRRDSDNGVREAAFDRAEDGAAIVRIKLERPRTASVQADGPGWIVNIADVATGATQALSIARSVAAKNRASVAVPLDGPRAIHNIRDLEVGDRLMVVTALGPARGFLKVQDFVELRMLPSIHGVVVQPIADDISAELSADKITISRPEGLSLSATSLGQQQVSTSFRAYTFDTQLWGFDRDAPFNARQSELIRLAAAAPSTKRRQARLNLARFYLAKDMAPEAKAVLDVALSDQRGSEDVTGSVLTAVADVMLDRPDDALKELAKPQVGNQQDAPIWRAIAYARQGRWSDARDIFKTVATAIGALPIELQRMAMKEALRSAVEVRDFNNASRLANEFETIGVTPELEP